MSNPKTFAIPALARDIPIDIRIVVVLPASLRPGNPKMLARANIEVKSVQRRVTCEGLSKSDRFNYGFTH